MIESVFKSKLFPTQAANRKLCWVDSGNFLMMPEMDGFEFLRQLRQHPQWRSLPVIVLTAKDLSAEERQWLDSQTQRIYQKGAGNKQILDEIRTLIASHSSQ